jgi:Protein of unknown function (DUF3987)
MQIDYATLRAAAFQQPGAVERHHGVKFQCPQCAVDGHDKHMDNACLFTTGKWGCAWAGEGPEGPRHRKAIWCVLRGSTNGHHRPTVDEPEAESEPISEQPYSFAPAFPPDHFVSRFIAYSAGCIDAAHEFFETVALTTLAAATPMVRARLRPYPGGLPTAFYAILIGDSTRSRKTSSIGLGLDLLDEAVPDCRLAEQSSPEAFVEQLGKRSRDSSLWAVDEFGETLEKLHHAKYMAGLRGLLLSLYEGRAYRYTRTTKRTKKGDPIDDSLVIDNPNLSVLAATTPSVFEIVTSRDVTSGFMARFAVIIPSSRPPRRGLEEPTDDLIAQREALARRLSRLYLWATSAVRPVRFVGDSLAIVDRFAEAIETSDALANDRAKAMLQRLNAMAVKLAMLSAAGRPDAGESDSLVVTADDARCAVVVATRWRDYAIAFGERVGDNALEQMLSRAMTVMHAKKKCARRAVAQLVHCSKRQMDEIEDTLVDRGSITVAEEPSKSGPAARVWRLA